MNIRYWPLAAFSLLVACSLNSASVAANGCGTPVKSGMHSEQMSFGLLDRDYKVYVPKNWDNKKPQPMVLGLHGGYGTGEIFNQQTKASDQADKYNMLLVLPDGYYKSWNAGTCCKPAAKFGVRDVEFISALVKKVSQDYCVNDDKVFATGFSNGAMLTHKIACENPSLLKAIAPVSGGIMSECPSGGKVAALLIQGKDDPRIFWDGGTFDGSYRPSMKEVVGKLAKRNRCADTEKSLAKSSSVAECHERNSCSSAPLRYCGIKGVGHQWPGGKSFWVDKLGPNTQDFDATREIFKFFAEQAK